MNSLPMVLQVIVVLIIANIIPLTLIVVIGNWRYFPRVLRIPLLLVGISLMEKFMKQMPVDSKVKDIADWTYIIIVPLFVILGYRYKWFWNNSSKKGNNYS